MKYREDPAFIFTNNIYDSNKLVVTEIANILSTSYGFSNDCALNSIKKEIYLAVESKKGFEHKKATIVLFIIYYTSILYSLFSSIFYMNKNKKEYDIVYEDMWRVNSWYKRVYSYLEFSDKIKEGILCVPVYFIKPFSKIVFNESTLPIIDKYTSNYIFSRDIAKKVFFNDFLTFFKLLKLTREVEYDLISIYLRILRKILIYNTQIKNIKSKIIIGTGDYYWSPLKYEIYKKSFENIVLIEYACKNKFSSEGKWISADYYFGYSKSIVEDRCDGLDIKKEIIYCGNIQLSPFIDKINNTKQVFDILFIHQPYYVDFFKTIKWIDCNLWKTEYFILVQNVKRFADEFPQYKICYFGKEYQDDPKYNKHTQKVMSILNGKNIFQSYTFGYDTYMNILKSKIILNQVSTLGYDALGLDRKTLWINYGNVLDGYEFELRDETVDVLIDDSYEKFKYKILDLLNNDKHDMFFNDRKENYMNVTKKPSLEIRDKINIILEE